MAVERSAEGPPGVAAPQVAAADLDALRRRVYGPGADAADVARYRRAAQAAAARQRGDGDPPARGEPSAGHPRPDPNAAATRRVVPGTPARAGRRRAALLAAGVAVVLLGAGVVVTQGTAPPAKRPPPAPTVLNVDVDSRAAFVHALAGGRSAGIDFWLGMHPEARAEAKNWVAATVSAHTGRGSTTVAIDPPTAAAMDGGRATVVLVLGTAATATWTVSTLAVEDDRTVSQRIAQRTGRYGAGVPATATFRFAAGGRPMRLHVAVPRAVRWEAAVIFTR